MSLTVSSTLTIIALISRSNNTADEKEPNQIAKQKQRVIEAILLFFVYGKPISEGGSYESPSFSVAFFVYCESYSDAIKYLPSVPFSEDYRPYPSTQLL